MPRAEILKTEKHAPAPPHEPGRVAPPRGEGGSSPPARRAAGGPPGGSATFRSAIRAIFQALFFLAALYLFFCSIELMSGAFKLSGKGFAQGLLGTISDPVAGLILGFLTTSLVQSSSTTTSIVVGLVAAGVVPIRLAVPIVMGANIGTTVTNTIVSLGHVGRRAEFRRAFAAATVHDFFNILAVLLLFPIELAFHPIERVAVVLERMFAGIGGIHLVSPLKLIVRPATDPLVHGIPHALPLVLLALAALFFSLDRMVRLMRRAVLSRAERLFDRVLFRNDLNSFLVGWLLTVMVQSSSATTSIIVPLAGTGVLGLRRIFPYTLGANVGTTITALLASFATGSPAALTVAFSHLVFNLFGISVFYPLRRLPIGIATWMGERVGRSWRESAVVVAIYTALFALPILYVVLR